MQEGISLEDGRERDKGLQLVARMENLARTNEKFRNWLQIGFDQAEAGQVIALVEGSWEEVQ